MNDEYNGQEGIGTTPVKQDERGRIRAVLRLNMEGNRT